MGDPLTKNTSPFPTPPQQSGQPQHSGPPQGQWAPPVPGAPVSTVGMKTFAGVLMLCLSAWLYMAALLGLEFDTSAMPTVDLLFAVAATAAGVLVLANRNNRRPGALVTALSVAGATIVVAIVAFVVDYSGPLMMQMGLVFTIPFVILAVLSLRRDRTAA